jgi:hypothetical protein
MATPLKDFRLGIPESVDWFLEGDAVAFGKDKSAIAREILIDWAKKKAHAKRVVDKRMATNGMQPEFDWETPEDDGATRSGRK